MSIAFESDGKVLPDWQLLLRGIALLLVLAAAAVLMIARSQGVFRQTVRVTAVLVNVGDGLPAKSDVKYQGVLVGQVDSVTPSSDGGPNNVRIDLKPEYVQGIPATVTARVVPSNVFAVPSIQLVYQGGGAPLAAGARIPEDQSLDTVRLQTSLTALSRIAAAAGRSESDPALGVLAVVERATSGRGTEAIRAGAELTRISEAFNAAMAPDGTASTLGALSDALAGLRNSAPDLMSAVHDAVGPMRAVAERKDQLATLLTGGLTTSATIGTALENNTETITDMTAKLSPVVGTLGAGSRNFVQMTTSQTRLARTFLGLWDTADQNVTAKVILELTPHRQYTRADCPRYGDLEGPSCRTAAIGGPTIIGPNAAAPTSYSSPIGGNVGPIGSWQEQQQIASILGGEPNAAADILFGPLLRGNDVQLTPAPDVPTGEPR
ncbi:MlaD family protein [Nocardia pseudovaccinii]|uniref:MlaD family protein n=1 Tax=Nocardia pseudovaccinii TaxID=189540 RepID=UPI0007A4BACC|nr:MCE family protein [Nocardia pseudovaccinii]